MFIDEFTTNNKWLTHITTKDHNGNGCFSALKDRKKNIQKIFFIKGRTRKFKNSMIFNMFVFEKKGKVSEEGQSTNFMFSKGAC